MEKRIKIVNLRNENQMNLKTLCHHGTNCPTNQGLADFSESLNACVELPFRL